jgi:glycine cleavage system H protein
MSEVRYTDQHEWIRLDGEEATVGITKYAAESLGDVVFVELPANGKSVAAGGEAAVVESVKAASDIYAPAGGTSFKIQRLPLHASQNPRRGCGCLVPRRAQSGAGATFGLQPSRHKRRDGS